MWLSSIWSAVIHPPDKTECYVVYFSKGEEGYDEAPLEESLNWMNIPDNTGKKYKLREGGYENKTEQ